MKKIFRIGVGGPVGSGKTAVIERLSKRLSKLFSIIIVTNDIYTKEDAKLLIKKKVLPSERIVGVETGGCPHTAIREDISMNMDAIEKLQAKFKDAEIAIIESGGDNLTAIFSPELSDYSLFVISVAEGDDIPKKGGPGIQKSDLLVINKKDLAPYVGADLDRMERDAKAARKDLPFIFADMMHDKGSDEIVAMILRARDEIYSH